MNDLEAATSQVDFDRGLRTLKDIVTALSFAVGAVSAAQLAEDANGTDFYEAVRRCEIMLIKRALRQTGGNQAQAARMLKLKQTTLHGKIKRYKLSPSVLLFDEPDSMIETGNSTSFREAIENVS